MVTELMKQPQYSPLSVAEMALTLFAVNRGYLDDVDVKKALAFEAALCAFMKNKYASLMEKIAATKDMDAETEQAMVAAVEEFKKSGAY
jgi:F-type H+-transporting ATPase subunit alpha